MLNKKEKGSYYEKEAGKYLEAHGYSVLEYNYRCRAGEIDIIAKDGAYLVFCEVKYRKDNKKGNALEAVAFSKQKTLSKCALYYITEKGLSYLPCRFDVVGINDKEITLVKNAFDYVS